MLLVVKWFYQSFARKIYKIINQSHEFNNTVIVFIIANDGQTDTRQFTIFFGHEISEI